MIKYLLLSLSLLSLNTYAVCKKLNQDSTKVEWKAFKTPAKAGVGGTFKEASFTVKEGKSITDILRSSSFTIKTQSVFTKNLARDKKIFNFFFSTMKNEDQIKGKVISINDKSITVALTMNGTTKEVPLKYSIKGDSFKANGIIDVFDFGMNKELAALNKACFAKHEGKTWSDVEISVSATFTSCK